MNFKKAFSLLELIFVILIIGILTGIALPLLNQNKNDANLLKAKIDFQMLNSALVLMRYEANLKQNPYNFVLDNAQNSREKERLFYCSKEEILQCNFANCCSYSLLQSPIYSSSKGWMKAGVNHYKFFIHSKKSIDFIYDNTKGILECVNSKFCEEFL